MNKKIVVARLLLSGHLIFCFNSSLFAGNLLASGPVGVLPFVPKKLFSPADDLPFFLKQATATDKPLALILKQSDDDSFDDENKTKAFDKHDEPDDFDNLSMPFEHDPEDESERPPDNKREDSAKDHVILEWNDTEQKITRRQVHVQTHELTEEKHLHVNIDLTSELAELKEELKAPEINATSIALPRASSPESVYPVTQNEKGESSEGEDSSSEDGGSDDNESEEKDNRHHSTDSGGSNNSEESANSSVEELIHFEGHIPEGRIQAATDRARADDGLTYIQVGDVRDDQIYYRINDYNANILEEFSLTEAGATKLQADNPQLFATPEAAITAYETIKQGDINKKKHTLEYQRLGELICKYRSNKPIMNNFFRREKKGQDQLDAWSMGHENMLKHIYKSQLKPLQVTDDNESLLVICSKNIFIWKLTEAGSIELWNRHPDLFQSKDAAHYFDCIMDISGERSTRREYISTHQYQAIAKLIQEYEQAGNVEFILTEEPLSLDTKPRKHQKRSHSASDDALVPGKGAKTESSSFSESRARAGVYIDTIPYGMLRRDFLSFDGERWCDREVSSKSRHKYELFLKPGKYFSKIKKFINNPILSQSYKISSLKQVFDEEPLTLTQFMKNIDSLLENFYEQTKELSEPDCSQINKPAENDRLNAPEGDHDQPDQKD